MRVVERTSTAAGFTPGGAVLPPSEPPRLRRPDPRGVRRAGRLNIPSKQQLLLNDPTYVEAARVLAA